VELGIKTLWLGDALKLNMGIFHMQIADFQDTTFIGTAFVTENLPLRSEGVDIDGEWQATSSLILSAAVTYADAIEFPTESDRADGILCSPCQATTAPRWNASSQATYRDSLSQSFNWAALLYVRYRGQMFNHAVKYFDHLPLHPWILAPAWRRKVWTVRIRSSRQEYIQSLDGRLQQPLAGSVLRGPRESCAAEDRKPQILAQIRALAARLRTALRAKGMIWSGRWESNPHGHRFRS
jgi:hypothetical protein